MANALGPYYVRINSHSPDAPHSMSIPTKNFTLGIGTGLFDTWSGTPVDAITMVEDLVTLMLPYFGSDYVFDNWTVFKQLLPTDFPQPLLSLALAGMVGTLT